MKSKLVLARTYANIKNEINKKVKPTNKNNSAKKVNRFRKERIKFWMNYFTCCNIEIFGI